MPAESKAAVFRRLLPWISDSRRRPTVPAIPLTILLAGIIGALGGYGAVIFSSIIEHVTAWTLEPSLQRVEADPRWWIVLALTPMSGLLVAAGAAAGISATFNAPMAGVIFSSEIILGSFAVESLTPIVIAAVIADVVQQRMGEHGLNAAFSGLSYQYSGAWNQLPTYILLGLFSGPESIYYKKLSRRGELIARGHELQRLEHVMVRDVMIRQFPTVRNTDTVTEIVRVARANTATETLPVMNQDDELLGFILPEDLHRVLDSDVSPHLVNAENIALISPVGISPDANLLEALREFGTRDIGSLPVESRQGDVKRLVGILLQVDVMRRYREEMLTHRTSPVKTRAPRGRFPTP